MAHIDSNDFDVSEPNCVGAFQGSPMLGPNSVSGGTLIGCFFFSGNVVASAGGVMTFKLTRVADFSTDQTVAFGFGGPGGTQFSDSGIAVNLVAANDLTVSPGVNP